MNVRPLPPPASRPPADTQRAPPAALLVDVVVLSGDLTLFEAIRHAVGERNPVWRARSAEEAVELLVTGRCGVLLIDMAAVSTQPAALVEQILEQFPDVVVVVAGRRDDESVLASLISDGLVYRFMHKPLSPKRAGMFLTAAIRSHVERREGRAGEPLLPLARELRSRVDPRKWMFVGSGLALFLALLAVLLVSRHGIAPESNPPPGAKQALPATAPLADPVLSRARAALAAGRYEAPPGRNALDLYAAVLLTRPGDLEARQGLATTIVHLLDGAERAAAAGNGTEARRIAERVLQVDAHHGGARAIVASLAAKPRPLAAPPSAPRPDPVMITNPAPAAVATHHGSAPPVAAPATVPLADPAPAARAVAAPPVRVQPDPLAPRIAGRGSLPTSPTSKSPRPTALNWGSPMGPGLPTAGYVRTAPAEVAGKRSTAPPAAPPLPAVQRRDLEPIAMPDPTYPPEAFRANTEGWVEIEFTVNELGTTRDIEVVAAEPAGVFDAAAIDAVARWAYRPRIVNGRPVAQRTSVTLRFDVDD